MVIGMPTRADNAIEKHAKALDKRFSALAERAASHAGSPFAFVGAMVFVIVCLVAGSLVDYSASWQMVIACTPPIVTFLLVFLIQNSQNRETRAVQLKLNELIRATHGAHTAMVNLEKLTESELKIIAEEYELLAYEARQKLSNGQTDQGVPEVLLPEPAQKVP